MSSSAYRERWTRACLVPQLLASLLRLETASTEVPQDAVSIELLLYSMTDYEHPRKKLP
jgi:hypothetical protein